MESNINYSQSNYSFGISDSAKTDCSLRQRGNESQTIDSRILPTVICDASPETTILFIMHICKIFNSNTNENAKLDKFMVTNSLLDSVLC